MENKTSYIKLSDEALRNMSHNQLIMYLKDVTSRQEFAIEHLKNEYSEQKQMHDHYRHCSESYFILIKELKEQLERMVEEYPTIRGIAFCLNAIHEFERRTY